jgi:hypothetical protein
VYFAPRETERDTQASMTHRISLHDISGNVMLEHGWKHITLQAPSAGLHWNSSSPEFSVKTIEAEMHSTKYKRFSAKAITSSNNL